MKSPEVSTSTDAKPSKSIGRKLFKPENKEVTPPQYYDTYKPNPKSENEPDLSSTIYFEDSLNYNDSVNNKYFSDKLILEENMSPDVHGMFPNSNEMKTLCNSEPEIKKYFPTHYVC